MGAGASELGFEATAWFVVPVFEGVVPVTGVEAPESPSFVTPDDGLETSDLSASPAGCAGVPASPGVTNSILVSLGWVAVEPPVGVSDSVPDSSE